MGKTTDRYCVLQQKILNKGFTIACDEQISYFLKLSKQGNFKLFTKTLKFQQSSKNPIVFSKSWEKCVVL